MLLNPAATISKDLKLGSGETHLDDPAYECWGINEIGVDPKLQRRGIGQQLLSWGLALAKEEKVPVTLASTPAGKAMYQKARFRQYGTYQWSAEAQELYLLMRWDPPSGSEE